MLVGLNRQERLHARAREIFLGRQGRFGDRGYEAQLNRASALSLVINALTVWNTRYLKPAAEELARLVGHYRFEEPVIIGELRPLRMEETA
jgi:TnpA family transposase